MELDVIRCMDALELLRSLPNASVNLIATDPPYMGVKDEAWDNQWANAADYIAWLRPILAEFQRVLKPNGSLYVFASPQMAARVELAIADCFNVLNHIRWIKEQGWHNKAEKDTLRGFLSNFEAVLFAEQFSSDGRYATLEYELNGYVFNPLKTWFRDRAKAYNITLTQLNTALGSATNGGGLASSYFGDKVEFQLPTRERYRQMQTAYPLAFNREYEDLRREYEDLRRPFAMSEFDAYTDTWTFSTVQFYEGKHPCEKPLDMLRHIVKVSSREGDVILDPFCGSGATLDAARQFGRRYIGGDSSAHWAAYAQRRLAQPFTTPMF